MTRNREATEGLGDGVFQAAKMSTRNAIGGFLEEETRLIVEFEQHSWPKNHSTANGNCIEDGDFRAAKSRILLMRDYLVRPRAESEATFSTLAHCDVLH